MNFSQRFVLVASLACAASAHAQGWNWQNPQPNGNGYASIWWIDQNTAWAVDTVGTAVRTNDGGATWTPKSVSPGTSLTRVTFTSAQSGWAVGTGGAALHTTDGGATWTTSNTGVGQAVTFYGLTWSGSQAGWIAGSAGTIVHTSDGGASWSKQTSGTTQTLSSVSFINASTGYACGSSGTIVKTTNAGAVWSLLTINVNKAWLRDIADLDEFNAEVVGDGGRIYSTTNRGVTWLAQNSTTTRNLLGVAFSSYFHGVAVGDGGTILETENSGAAWTLVQSRTTESIKSVHHFGEQLWTAVGNSGQIIVSTDGARNWQKRTTGPTVEFLDVDFADTLYGWATGRNGQVWRTTNGGAAWTDASTSTFHNINGVSFVNRTMGWAVGDTAYIIHTSNGGTSWVTENLPIVTKMNLLSVKFVDMNIGWICGSNGAYLFKTTNGGATWTTSYTNITGNITLRRVAVLNQTVCAVGTNGAIYHSFNSGTTWLKQTSGTTQTLYGVSLPTATTAIVSGAAGTLLYSSNAGSNWTPLNSGTGQNILAVALRPDSIGRACGTGGLLMRTSDNGTTWLFAQPPPTLNTLNNISLPTARTAFAVGQSGSILKSYQPQSALSTSRRALHFDTIAVHSCDSIALTALNVGDDSIAINAVNLTGLDSTTFTLALSKPLPAIVHRGESYTMTVTFCPKDTGAWSALLAIVNTSPAAVVNLVADGYSGSLQFAYPDSLGFGTVATGDFFDTSLHVENTGGIPLRLKTLAITGPDAAMFNYNGTFAPMSVATGDSLELKFLFLPTAPGPRSAIAELTTNGNEPLRVFLHGNDGPSAVAMPTAPGGREIAVAPFPLRDHGTVRLQGTAGPVTLTLRDVLGHVVWEQRLVDAAQTVTVPMRIDAPSGVYLLAARSATGTLRAPVVVLR